MGVESVQRLRDRAHAPDAQVVRETPFGSPQPLDGAVSRFPAGFPRAHRRSPGEQRHPYRPRSCNALGGGADMVDERLVERDQCPEYGFRRVKEAKKRRGYTRIAGVRGDQPAQPLDRQAHGAAMCGMLAVPLLVAMAAIPDRRQIAAHVQQPRGDGIGELAQRSRRVEPPQRIYQEIGPGRSRAEGARLKKGIIQGARKADGDDPHNRQQSAERPAPGNA